MSSSADLKLSESKASVSRMAQDERIGPGEVRSLGYDGEEESALVTKSEQLQDIHIYGGNAHSPSFGRIECQMAAPNKDFSVFVIRNKVDVNILGEISGICTMSLV